MDDEDYKLSEQDMKELSFYKLYKELGHESIVTSEIIRINKDQPLKFMPWYETFISKKDLRFQTSFFKAGFTFRRAIFVNKFINKKIKRKKRITRKFYKKYSKEVFLYEMSKHKDINEEYRNNVLGQF